MLHSLTLVDLLLYLENKLKIKISLAPSWISTTFVRYPELPISFRKIVNSDAFIALSTQV